MRERTFTLKYKVNKHILHKKATSDRSNQHWDSPPGSASII